MTECEECNDSGVVPCGRCGDGEEPDASCPVCLGEGIDVCPEECAATEE